MKEVDKLYYSFFSAFFFFFFKTTVNNVLHGDVVVSTVASQREGSRFNSQLWRLHVLPVYAWVLRFSGFLPPSESMHVRLNGVSKM